MGGLKINIVIYILFFPLLCTAQQSLLPLGFWNLSSLSGDLKAGGLYAAGDVNTYGIKNKFNTFNYYGGIFVKTSSFIWNPNFLTVDVEGGYYPESRQDLYLLSPNLYNVINTTKLHFRATLFPQKVISLSTYLNFDDSYDSRENLTDIRTNSQGYGGTFAFRNKMLPLTVSYNQNIWNSREIATQRNFFYNQANLNGKVSKSFGLGDHNDLLYNHYDYRRDDFNSVKLRNVSDVLQLTDAIFFDSAQRSYLNSNIMGTIQTGNDSFTQFRASENFLYKLPYNFTINSSYGYFYMYQNPVGIGQHSITARLGNQLYESLNSGLLYEYNNIDETSYHEVNDKVGIDLNYTKKVLKTNVLSIIYSYNRLFERRASTDEILTVVNEQYTISDRVILKRPYINTATLVVKDATGTIIYQLGADYLLTTLGNYIEIQRIPGGQIADNSSIYVFYNATQPGTYSYDVDIQTFYINFSVSKHLFDIYYKTSRNDYSEVRHADALLLNYLTNNIYGASSKIRNATIGLEQDNYESNITPYKMIRYYFNLQGRIGARFLYSVNANWRDYAIPTETEHRVYKDMNGMVSFSLGRKSKLDFTLSYQNQEGNQLNLDLQMARLKFTTRVDHLNIVLGLDSYNRTYLATQNTDYIGVYIQLIKKFKY
jgi:hypothetical protein